MLKIFGNGTDGVSWTPEPTKRGTFSILSSCLVTIILCVWTSLHLNIPRPSDERRCWIRRRSLWDKVYLLIVALVAPEIVAYTAFHQRSEALELRMSFRDLEEKPKENREGQEMDISELSITQAFYAIMGGYQIHIPSENNPFPDGQTYFSLQPETLKDFAKSYPDTLKIASDLEIQDKSKANSIAKALICVQASWFILQCITRMAMSLLITLLELNTFAHSLCALLIYFFWWHKPLDVEQPTQITGLDAEKYAAYIWLIAQRNGTLSPVEYLTPMNPKERYNELRRLIKKDGIDSIKIRSLVGRGLLSYEDYKSLSKFRRVSVKQKYRRRESSRDEEARINAVGTPIQSLHRDPEISVNFPEIGHLSVESKEQREEIPRHSRHSRPTTDSRQESLVKGLYFSANAIADSGADLTEIVERAADIVKDKLQVDPIAYRTPDYQQLVVDRFDDIPRELNPFRVVFSDSSHRQLKLCLYASGFLYGGLHVLAWSATFRSPTESLLWKIASVTVLSAMPVIDGLRAICFLVSDIERPIGCCMLSFVALFILASTLCLCVVIYCLARGYLVVECFIALAHSPIGVYAVPQWSSYVPHIG